MGVENAQMMWLRTPSYCYKTLTKAIRKTITTKGAQGLVEALSDIVAEYWTTYSDMHSRESACHNPVFSHGICFRRWLEF